MDYPSYPMDYSPNEVRDAIYREDETYTRLRLDPTISNLVANHETADPNPNFDPNWAVSDRRRQD